MALKHLEQVITGAGLGADDVKKLLELPEDAKDFVPDTHVTALRDNVATGLKNDPKFYEGINQENLPKEMLKAIEAQQYGRAATIVRGNLLKGAGLKEEDFKELGDEGKKIEVFTPAFMKKIMEGKVTDAQLQTALQAAHTELETLKGTIPDLEKKYKGEYESKIQAHQVETSVLTTLAAIPGLKVSPELLHPSVLSQLRSQYHLALNNGQVVLRQLDKPDLKVLTDNNTKELTLDRAILELLKAKNAVEDKTKKITKESSSTTVDADGKGGLKTSSHLNGRLKARLEQEAKASGQ